MLTSLSNYLLQKSLNSGILSLLLEGKKDYILNLDENWLYFVKTRLNSINLKEKPFLCNVNPKQK